MEKIGDVWTFIDPDGYVYINVALNSIKTSGTRLRGQYKKHFRSTQEWLEHVDTLMESLSFNSYGIWSELDKLKAFPRPYCDKLDFIVDYAKTKGVTKMGYGHHLFDNDVMHVFDPEFEDFALAHAETLSAYNDDPYLVGFFSDNELPFSKTKGIITEYLKAKPADVGRQGAEEWLRKNRLAESEVTSKREQEFMDLVIERYFSVVGHALKTYLPNHLYLGTRFHGLALRNDALFQIAGKYVDVISVNYYHRWTPEYKRLNKWAKLANKP